MSTELEAVTSKELATQQTAAMQAMMSDITLSDVELTKVSFPGAGGTTWEVDGFEPSKQLIGTVIDDYSIDSLYLTEYDGTNNKPDALWVGGVFQSATDEGYEAGIIGGPLANEPLNGYDPNRKTISNRWRIFLSVDGELFPIQIEIPAMSRKTWVNFKLKSIGGRGLRTTQAEVALSLEKATSQGGIPYARLVPSFVRVLSDDEQVAAAAKAEAFKPLTRPVYGDAAPVSSDAGPATDVDDAWPLND